LGIRTAPVPAYNQRYGQSTAPDGTGADIRGLTGPVDQRLAPPGQKAPQGSTDRPWTRSSPTRSIASRFSPVPSVPEVGCISKFQALRTNDQPPDLGATAGGGGGASFPRDPEKSFQWSPEVTGGDRGPLPRRNLPDGAHPVPVHPTPSGPSSHGPSGAACLRSMNKPELMEGILAPAHDHARISIPAAGPRQARRRKKSSRSARPRIDFTYLTLTFAGFVGPAGTVQECAGGSASYPGARGRYRAELAPSAVLRLP